MSGPVSIRSGHARLLSEDTVMVVSPSDHKTVLNNSLI